MIPLQTTFQASYLAYLVLLLLTVVAIGMGLYISFQAYRGFRRNNNRRMLYLALGLALVTVIPFCLTIAVTILGAQLSLDPHVYSYYLPIGSRLVEITGLGCIIYSLSISSRQSHASNEDQTVRIRHKEK